MRKTRSFARLCILLLASGIAPGAQADGTVDNRQEMQQIVSLSPAEIDEFGIELGVARPGKIVTRLSLPGEVRANADRLAHIVPRYSGIVTEVRAAIGEHVKQGQVLAIVESDQTLAPFELKTLIAGTVISKHITLGEAVSRDRDSYVIADLSTVWVDLTVYQRDLNRIRTGQEAHIYVGHENSENNGVISYVTPIVDEATRTATARIVLPNLEGQWRPGMFVTATIVLQTTDASIVVPRSALQTIRQEPVVFVETSEGFAPQPVTIGQTDETQLEVLSGLVAGQRYVTIGGFTLKAELAKTSFGDGHAH